MTAILLTVPVMTLVLSMRMSAVERPLDTARVQRVYQRLLAVIEPPATSYWPPTLHIIEDAEVNAFAAMMTDQEDPRRQIPQVYVTTGMLTTLSPRNEDYYAYLLGHELAHHIAGHVTSAPPKAVLPSSVYSQMQEFEADSLGFVYAGRAGYSIGQIREGIRALINTGMEYPAYAAIGETHPTFKQRLERLDRTNSTIWRALTSFDNGVFFLRLEQYMAAERCFRHVISEFPSAHEAWGNLGYALLMLYCDALDESDVRRFDIGQIVLGGINSRARSIENQIRGADEELWWDAVGALREAVRLKPNSVVAKGALGLAYLVKPDGKDRGQAARYLDESAEIALKDETVEPALRATILANAAVLALDGTVDEALSALNRIDTFEVGVRSQWPEYRLSPNVRSAVSYNRAMALSRSGSSKHREASMRQLSEYLRTAPVTHWWNLAYERYKVICAALGKMPESSNSLADRKAEYRVITTLKLPGGGSIAVSDPVEQARLLLPNAVDIPIAGRTNLKRFVDAHAGIAFLAGTHVLAVILDQAHSPGIELRGSGLGANGKTLSIGMSRDEIDVILETVTFTNQELLVPGELYRVYGSLGLALRIRQGVLRGIVLTNTP